MSCILRITIRVPPSATPQGVVEWLEPTALTGLGYFSVSFRTEMISSTLSASTTTCGDDTMLPNQFCTCISPQLQPTIGGLQSPPLPAPKDRPDDGSCGSAPPASARIIRRRPAMSSDLSGGRLAHPLEQQRND